MIIYILLFILFMVFLLIKKQSNYVLMLAILFLLNVFRGYEVGTDYGYNYKYSYDTNWSNKSFSDEDFLSTNIEVGLNAFTNVSKTLGMQFTFVNLLCALVIFTFTTLTIKQKSEDKIFSVVLYLIMCVYFASFNVIRQATAASIFLYALKYLEGQERNIIKYFIFCVLASFFHSTALLLSVIGLLYFLKFKMNRHTAFALIILSFLIPISGLDLKIFSAIANLDVFGGYYAYYLLVENEFTSRMILITSIPLLLMSFLCIYLIFSAEREVSNIYFTIWILGICFYNVSINFNYLFRVAQYFLPAGIIAIPAIIGKRKVLTTRRGIFTLASLSIYYFLLIYMNYNGVVPYKFL